MTAHTPHASAARTAPTERDLDARCDAIGGRILAVVDAMLDEIASPRVRLAAHRAAIADLVWARCAPAICRNVTCRRAQSCRRTPCALPRPKVSGNDHATRPR